MRVLIVGFDARDHALAWRIRRDRPDCELFVASGNAGIARIATRVPLSVGNVAGIVAWCREQGPDLVLIGPGSPYVAGIVGALAAAGVRAFGPDTAGAMIESSKVWAAELATVGGIPMPGTYAFDSADAADAFVKAHGRPFVVKPDGRGPSEGVAVTDSVESTHAAIDRVARKREYGDVGARFLLQERVHGLELQVAAIADGDTHRIIGALEGFKYQSEDGRTTSSMGNYGPVASMTPQVAAEIDARVFAPLFAELRRRGIRYGGFIEAGVMLTVDGPLVLEYNCRLGDPSACAILPLLGYDLIDVVQAALDDRLRALELPGPTGAAVCVVLRRPRSGDAQPENVAISGLESIDPGTLVFHARTSYRDGEWLIPEGGALAITGLGESVARARERAYEAAAAIHFDGAEWRADIGAEAR